MIDTTSGLFWEDVVRIQSGDLASQGSDGTLRPLFNAAGDPLRSLRVGWRPRGVLWIGDAAGLLEITGPDGETTTGLLDGQGRCIAMRGWSSPAGLTWPEVKALLPAVQPTAERVYQDLLHEPQPELTTSFTALTMALRQTRTALFKLAGPPVRPVILPATPASSIPHLAEFDLRAHLLRGFAGGSLALPRLNGEGTTAQTAFFHIDPGAVMIRAQDAVEQPAWFAAFVIGRDGGMRLRWLLPPGATAAFGGRGVRPDEVAEGLRGAALQMSLMGSNLARWLRKPAGLALVHRLAHQSHLGHMIWDSFSGLHRFCAAIRAGTPCPPVYDVAAGSPPSELFGPLETIFPEMNGRVRRNATTVGGASLDAAREGLHAVPIKGNEVVTTMRRRILRATWFHPIVSALERVRLREHPSRPSPPTLVLGLRLQDRTMPDLLDVYAALGERLLKHAPNGELRVIIDGMNANPANGTMRSGPVDDIDRLIQREHQFVAQLTERWEGLPITTVSCVGMVMAENLYWLRMANCFVAPFGAGLVKYRWIMNLPGFALCSAMNLKFATMLRIYDTEGGLENPAPMHFTELEEVRDIYPADMAFRPDGRSIEIWRGGLSALNFTLNDPEKLLQRIEDMFRASLSDYPRR